jgi:hypothetical protein
MRESTSPQYSASNQDVAAGVRRNHASSRVEHRNPPAMTIEAAVAAMQEATTVLLSGNADV